MKRTCLSGACQNLQTVRNQSLSVPNGGKGNSKKKKRDHGYMVSINRKGAFEKDQSKKKKRINEYGKVGERYMNSRRGASENCGRR